MTPPRSPGEVARTVIESSLYMVLATADRSGRPWSSPVYFAEIDHREFFWVSSPEASHSHNITVRPEVCIAIFDSSAPIGTGQGVYLSAVAGPAEGSVLDRGIDAFSRRSLSHGGSGWTIGDVRENSGLRLYRAVAQAHWILAKDGQPDHRIPAQLA
jgi:hypothetical protein